MVEHLNSPEMFFDQLRDAMKSCTNTRLIISTPNIGFFIGPINAAVGAIQLRQAWYSRHDSYTVVYVLFAPPVAGATRFPGFGDARHPRAVFLSHSETTPTKPLIVAANKACLRLWPTLFSYQILVVAQPRQSLELLLQRAVDKSTARADKLFIVGSMS